MLRAYLPADVKIDLALGEHGKPYLQAPVKPLQFNVSDTQGWGLFAFSWNDAVGVDVESLARSGNFHRIIQRRFAPQEQNLVYNASPDSVANDQVGQESVDNAAFLACWTRKEAYGKALGVGLNYPTREQVLCSSLQEPVTVTRSPDSRQWCLQQLAISAMPTDFVGCVASEGNQPKRLRAFCLPRVT